MLAFGCGSSVTPPRAVTPSASPSVRASATVDPRVAEVEAAARRYVQALADSMRTGSPDELDSLSVRGSQAEGNAGVAAHVVQGTGRCFVTSQLNVTSISASIVGSADAIATIGYALSGYDAEWPSIKQLAPPRIINATHTLELQLVSGRWLVAVER
jgi:hypothetical protein